MDSWLKPRRQLIEDLRHQLLMLQNLPHFHDPHDSRLNQQLPVLLDVLVGGFLLHLQLGLHRNIDIHPEFFTTNEITTTVQSFSNLLFIS